MPGPPEDGVDDREAVRAQRDRIVGALLDDLETLSTDAAAAIHDQISAYADREDAGMADVRDQVRRHFGGQLAALLEGRPVASVATEFARTAAMRRARRGLAIDDYMAAYRVGMEVLWAAVVERADPTRVGRDAALSLVEPLMTYANVAATRAGKAYVEFQQHVQADAERTRRDVLEHLLAGRVPERGPLHAAASRYGIHPDVPALVAVAVLADAAAIDTPTAVAAVLATALTGAVPALVVARQAEIVAVTVLAERDDAAQTCRELADARAALIADGVHLSVGVSTVARGVGELPRAYEEACGALAEAGDDGVLALPTMTPFAYLTRGADETAHRLVDARLQAFLIADRAGGGTLIATVRAFADADLNVRATARRLGVHPNTVQYRLKRIEQRTGRTLRSIEDLVAVLVAIELDVGP